MTVGAMLRSALTGGASKSGYRELEVLEENHITYDRDHLVVPWDFLAEYGRHAATLAYVRTLEEGIPPSWEHIHYTRPEVDQAQAVITWHGELIRSYAVQAASEKVTRLANETITMLREKREKVVKEDGSIAARNVIARLGKGELRTDAALREQVLDVLVVHRHLIPTARRGHYMMVVPHD